MKKINKKELHDLFISYDEWFRKEESELNDAKWKLTYSMDSDIEKNISNYLNGDLYRIIYSSKRLNEDITFEQIVKCLEAIGFEVK